MSISEITRSVLVGAAITAVSFGATPVARVIGTEPIDVDGIRMPARNYSPVAIGDEVATKTGQATLQFRDGSNVVLQPNSSLKIEGKGANLRVRVVKGEAKYDLSPASRIRITDSKGETISNVITSAVPNIQPVTRPEAAAQALFTSNSTTRQFGVMPSSPVATAQFTTGVLRATGATTATFTLPNGQVLNLSATTTTVNGVATTTYKIESVTVPVTNSSGAVTGSVTVEPTGLVGATISVSASNGGGGNVTVAITSSSGQQIPPSQVATDINSAASSAAPAGSTPVQSQPVKTGAFSPGS